MHVLRDLITQQSALFELLANSRQNYRSVMPITTKNIGKRINKRGRKTYTGSGAKEAARAARRVEHAQA